MNMITHFIDGERFGRPAERHGDVFNPATGVVSAQVAFATPLVVDAAVEAAKRAFPGWREASLAKRTRVLFAFRELLERRKGDLARIITAEHGKVVGDATGEVNRGIEVVEFACGIAHLLKGGYSENVSS